MRSVVLPERPRRSRSLPPFLSLPLLLARPVNYSLQLNKVTEGSSLPLSPPGPNERSATLTHQLTRLLVALVALGVVARDTQVV